VASINRLRARPQLPHHERMSQVLSMRMRAGTPFRVCRHAFMRMLSSYVCTYRFVIVLLSSCYSRGCHAFHHRRTAASRRSTNNDGRDLTRTEGRGNIVRVMLNTHRG
jgi:hypothetical protein